jgi:hypothetical protein
MSEAMMRTLLAFGCGATVVLGAGSCTTDVKGASCSDSLLFSDLEGNDYCKDDGAPLACTQFEDRFYERASACTGTPEADLRGEFPPLDCENAVATSLDYDACLDGLDEPGFCVDGSIVGIETCQGAIIISG